MFNVLPSSPNYWKEIWNSQIIRVVIDQNTEPMNGKRPFEDRVFARFDALDLSMRHMDSSIRDLNSRMQTLEIRAYDTKPIWEQALKEIVETRREMSKRLDRLGARVLENRADIRDVEDRLDKIEPKPAE
jgi:hypothetical protein